MSSKFAKDLKAALKEAIAHKEGKLDAIAEYIEIPEPLADYKSKEIKNGKLVNIRTILLKNIDR